MSYCRERRGVAPISIILGAQLPNQMVKVCRVAGLVTLAVVVHLKARVLGGCSRQAETCHRFLNLKVARVYRKILRHVRLVKESCLGSLLSGWPTAVHGSLSANPPLITDVGSLNWRSRYRRWEEDLSVSVPDWK